MCPAADMSPAQSDGEASEGAGDPHEGDDPLEAAAERRGHPLRRRSQDHQVGRDRRDVQQVQQRVQFDELQDTSSASAGFVFCHPFSRGIYSIFMLYTGQV